MEGVRKALRVKRSLKGVGHGVDSANTEDVRPLRVSSINTKSGRVAQVCKPKIQEAEVGGLLVGGQFEI